MVTFYLEPSSTSAAVHATRIFGADNVNAGSWGSTVFVTLYNQEEYEAGKELLKDEGIEILPLHLAPNAPITWKHPLTTQR